MSGRLRPEVRDKLRRLRRDGELPPPPTDLPPSLRRRLDRATDRELAELVRDPRLSTGPPADLREHPGPAGALRARIEARAEAHVHGAFRLDEVDAARAEAFALLAGDPRLEGIDLRDAVYLDTETTGLSGGAGTYVFLVGLARFTGGGEVELWQGFLDGPDEEPALLAETARRIRAAGAVVSFFGKSFDRHRLEDKMRLHGIESPFTDCPHLDLFHPLRRLYGGAYDNCRLKTFEQELCGFARTDDLPGSLAPAAWFDYLAGRPHLLEGVFEHNLNDVLSLIVLAAHLGRSLEETRDGGAPLPGPDGHRARGLARTLAELRRREEAVPWFRAAGERGVLDEDRALRHLYAETLRHLGEGAEAERELRHLRDAADEVAVRSCVSLAMLYEHVLRDLVRAREACEDGLARAERVLVGRARAQVRRDLEKRLARLARRMQEPGAEN